MSLEPAVDLLRCPVCSEGLALDGRALRCSSGHSFDVARQGQVNLLGGPEPGNADTAAMLDARARVHAAGVFAPIAKLVAQLTSGRQRILEVGCGTGYYLAAALGPGPCGIGIGLDVSKAAARRTAQADPRIAAVIADVWRGLPIADHCLDLVLAVFAPRNLPEFSRVLTPSGRLIVVTPRPGHLAGLRDAHGLLEVPAGKATNLAAAAAEFFDLIDTRVVKYRAAVDASQAEDLIAMGPNAFHRVPGQVAATTVGIDVTVQRFAPLR